MMDIKSEKKYQTMPDLSPMEYEELKEDIARRGLEYPIIIDNEGYIVDGYNRYQIACELGINLIDDDFSIRNGYNYEELIELSIVLNSKRRNLTMEQKKELVKKYLKIFAEKSNRTIAKIFGVSHETVNSIRKEEEDVDQISQQTTVTTKDGKKRKRKNAPKAIKQEDYPNVLPNVFLLYQSGKVKLNELKKMNREDNLDCKEK